ncbi:MAG TPA: hypothetical protein VHD38_00625 [Candidatus Paceibacterota bacterium]|nr:hypothetical protein [Candidatus Paceibacterota bacterium]
MFLGQFVFMYMAKLVTAAAFCLVLLVGALYSLQSGLIPSHLSDGGESATSTTTTTSTSSQANADTGSTSVGAQTLVLAIGQSGTALGVTLTPKTVLEDSRCPSGVQCIWAGRVRLNVTISSGLGTSDQEFTVGQTVTTEAETITLASVTPARAAGTEIGSAQYRFTFEVKKR